MKINKITLHHRDGSLHYVDGEDDIWQVVKCIPTTLKWKHTSPVQTLNNKYFALVDELDHNVKTGYTRAQLHESLKPLLFNKFDDFTHYFKGGVNTRSTKDLTYDGWVATIQQLKEVASDVFNYTFQQQ